jgi:protein-S-isoprenylcysteine O-methyltransferase Ste14
MKQNALSAIALIILVGCIAVLYLRGAIFGTEAIAIGVQIAAALLMIWARLTFGFRSFHGTARPTKGGLVTSGPYKYFRHPIYAAIVYFLLAALVDHFSAASAGLILLSLAMLAIRMKAEEHLLVEIYPAYAEYSRTTKRVIPFLV